MFCVGMCKNFLNIFQIFVLFRMIRITFMYISGNTFRIPDSIMGLTFLAAGMSVPEAVSSVIVTNQGM